MVKWNQAGETYNRWMNGQIEMLFFDPEDIIPDRHLLRKIDKRLSIALRKMVSAMVQVKTVLSVPKATARISQADL